MHGWSNVAFVLDESILWAKLRWSLSWQFFQLWLTPYFLLCLADKVWHSGLRIQSTFSSNQTTFFAIWLQKECHMHAFLKVGGFFCTNTTKGRLFDCCSDACLCRSYSHLCQNSEPFSPWSPCLSWALSPGYLFKNVRVNVLVPSTYTVSQPRFLCTAI